MFFFGLPAILVAVYGWNFRILQTISIKRALNKESLYDISLKLDEKCNRDISYSSQIVFFQSLHYTCFSSVICPLQVPGSVCTRPFVCCFELQWNPSISNTQGEQKLVPYGGFVISERLLI